MYVASAPATAMPSLAATHTEREDADGRERDDRSHQHERCILHAGHHTQEDHAPFRLNPRERRSEHEREQNERQHRAAGRGLHRIRRHEVDQPLRDTRKCLRSSPRRRRSRSHANSPPQQVNRYRRQDRRRHQQRDRRRDRKHRDKHDKRSRAQPADVAWIRCTANADDQARYHQRNDRHADCRNPQRANGLDHREHVHEHTSTRSTRCRVRPPARRPVLSVLSQRATWACNQRRRHGRAPIACCCVATVTVSSRTLFSALLALSLASCRPGSPVSCAYDAANMDYTEPGCVIGANCFIGSGRAIERERAG